MERRMLIAGGMALGVVIATLALTFAATVQQQAQRERALQVAAAADLRPALAEIARLYQEQTGQAATLTFGSTGQLTQQIEQGAPFDVFLAANEAFIERLKRGGHTVAGTEQRYARGRLALVTSPALNLPVSALSDLTAPSIRYIAIANPEHAPYGVAAQDALEALGLWGTLRPRLVYGENVQQAMQYVQTGQADAGIVAVALVIPTQLRWTLVPQELHRPLDQALAILRRTRSEADARAFVSLVMSPEGQALLGRYGFEPPASP
ncbi:MAG: molybdate ABC transporter substrate-binding protein [Chloroflexota bacterium]|nr:molybdate ABC transporter substrate-binding protein [Dehalococcoidia bacterium]MDW8252249.1 molybdate ABC transporter substrate-binding protein [Chloroflexota bacterium]